MLKGARGPFRRSVGVALVLGVLVVLGVGTATPRAGATEATCTVSAPQGVPASSLSGTFPFRVSCSGLPAGVQGVRFEVSGQGVTMDVRVYETVASTSNAGFGSSFSVTVQAGALWMAGAGGDCTGGTAPVAGFFAASGTRANFGSCVDTTEGTCCVVVTPGLASSAAITVGVETQTLLEGGTVGSDLQEYVYFSSTNYIPASCNAGGTCGTVSFVSLPGDDPLAVNSWFPVSMLIESFLASGMGFVVGLAFDLARSALS